MNRRFSPLALSASLALGVSLGAVGLPNTQHEQLAMRTANAEAALKLKLSTRKMIVNPGDRISFRVDGADTYQVSSKPSVGELAIQAGYPVDANGELGWPTTGWAKGIYEFTITGTRGGVTGKTKLIVSLGKPNHAPKFVKLKKALQVIAGKKIEVVLQATDKDEKDQLFFEPVVRANSNFVMPEGAELVGNKFTFPTSLDQLSGGDNGKGLFKFTVSVSDGIVTTSKPLRIQLKKPKKIKKQGPYLGAVGNQTFKVGEERCLDLDVRDRDGKTKYEDLAVDVVSGDAAGYCELNENDKWVFCFEPESAGKFDFQIEALDEDELSSGVKSFSIDATMEVHSPVIQGIDLDGQLLTGNPVEIVVEENEPLYFEVVASDPDEDMGDVLSYHISSLGQHFDSETGVFDMESATNPRTINATITVEDSTHAKATRDLIIRINPESSDPTLPPALIIEGNEATYTIGEDAMEISVYMENEESLPESGCQFRIANLVSQDYFNAGWFTDITYDGDAPLPPGTGFGFIGTSGVITWNFAEGSAASYIPQTFNLEIQADCGTVYSKFVKFQTVAAPVDPEDPTINHRPYFKPQSRDANLKPYVDLSMTVKPGSKLQFVHSLAMDDDGDEIFYGNDKPYAAPPGSTYTATTGSEFAGITFDATLNPMIFTWNVPLNLPNQTIKVYFRAKDGKATPLNSYDQRVLTIYVRN